MKLKITLFVFFVLAFVCQQVRADDLAIYVANRDSNQVLVIDPATDAVTAAINVGTQPEALELLPDGSFLYVVNAGTNDVDFIDTSDNSKDGTINVGTSPAGITIHPDGSTIYVTNRTSNTVSVINTTTNTVTATINVGTTPRGITITPDGAFLYVANTGDDTVSVIATASNTVTATINLAGGSFPINILASHDGNTVYVSNFLGTSISKISTASNTISGNVTVGFEPFGVVLNEDDSILYAINAGDNDIDIIDTNLFTVSNTASTGNFPRQGALNLAESKLYVVDSLGDTVSVINTATRARTTVNDAFTAFSNPFDVIVLKEENVGSDDTEDTQDTEDAGDDDSDNTPALDVNFSVTATFEQVNFPEDDVRRAYNSGNFYTSPTLGRVTIQNGQYFFVKLVVTNNGSEAAPSSYLTARNDYQTKNYYEYLLRGTEYYIYDDDDVTLLEEPSMLDFSTTYLESYDGEGTLYSYKNLSLGVFEPGQTKIVRLIYSGSSFCHLASNCTGYEDLQIPFVVGSTEANVSTTGNLAVTFAQDGFVSCGCHIYAADRPVFYSLKTTALFILIPLIPIFVLRFRKSLSKSGLGVLLLLIFLIPQNASATTNQYTVLQNTSVLGSSGVIYTLGSEVIPQQFNFSFETGYHFGFRRTSLIPSGKTKHLLVHNLAFSYSPSERFQFDVVLPIVSYNSITPFVANPYSSKAGIADILVRGHYNFWKSKDRRKGLALIPFITAPTGNESNYLGNKYPRGGLLISGDWNITDRLYTAVNLGAEGHQPVSDANYALKSRLLAGWGLSYQIFEQWVLSADMTAFTSINQPFRSTSVSGIDYAGSVKYNFKERPVSVYVSAGGPAVITAVQSRFHGMAGVNFGFGQKGQGLSRLEKQALQPTIYFSTASTFINSKERIKLDRVAELLKEHPKVKLIVAEGHADSRGSNRSNLRLSMNRARMTKSYLLKQGVSSSRIEVTGFSESQPIASNQARLGRAQNRRVEIRMKK